MNILLRISELNYPDRTASKISWWKSEVWLRLVVMRGCAAGASGDIGEQGGRDSSAAMVHGGGCGSAHTPRAAPGLGYT